MIKTTEEIADELLKYFLKGNQTIGSFDFAKTIAATEGQVCKAIDLIDAYDDSLILHDVGAGDNRLIIFPDDEGFKLVPDLIESAGFKAMMNAKRNLMEEENTRKEREKENIELNIQYLKQAIRQGRWSLALAILAIIISIVSLFIKKPN